MAYFNSNSKRVAAAIVVVNYCRNLGIVAVVCQSCSCCFITDHIVAVVGSPCFVVVHIIVFHIVGIIDVVGRSLGFGSHLDFRSLEAFGFGIGYLGIDRMDFGFVVVAFMFHIDHIDCCFTFDTHHLDPSLDLDLEQIPWVFQALQVVATLKEH